MTGDTLQLLRRAFRPRFALCLAAALSALAPGRACGDYIRLEVLPQFHFKDGQIELSAVVNNQGNADAHELAMEVHLHDAKQRTDGPAVLACGTNCFLRTDFAAAELPVGSMVAVLAVHYRDAAGYPNIALHTLDVLTTSPEELPSPPTLATGQVQLGPNASIKVGIATPSGSTRFTSRLHLPAGVSCETAEIAGPFTNETAHVITFPITASGIRPGTSTRAFVTVRVDDRPLEHEACARVPINVPALRRWPGGSRGRAFLLLAAAFAVLAVVIQCIPKLPLPRARPSLLFWTAVAASTATVCFFLPGTAIFSDTMTVGGDTPAHNYLASSLAHALFAKGRIVHWASGWWCGFPAFQYYFPLPYLLVALLDLVLPFNIAFKLVSIAGVVLTPLAAGVAARIAGLRRPIPALAAVAALPVLFDPTHVMWGANTYSALAGMIANSYSFPLMLLFLASLARDLVDGATYKRTVVLLALVLLSHFFTSVMAGICTAILALSAPLLRPADEGPIQRPLVQRVWRAVQPTFVTWGIALLLMSWWVIPLIAKRAWSVDFGQNWDLQLWREELPTFVKWCIPPALAGAAVGCRRRQGYIIALTGMAVAGLTLFYFGFALSPVFVNVRLYPFIVAPILLLAAAGVGFAIARSRIPAFAAGALYLLVAVFGMPEADNVLSWAQWNYEGLEAKTDHQVFERLVDPLRGTPGRLANDLHPFNRALGSSRVFESVPHRIGKPIIEGGIVNSGLTSMFSYYIQGEMSDNTAGFPPIMRPASFDITNGTRHLEYFNVKHFIARSQRTRAALHAMAEWQHLAGAGGWELFELTTHDGSYVTVPERPPVPVQLDAVPKAAKQAGLQWMYHGDTAQTYVLLDPDEPAPPGAGRALTPAEYHDRLAHAPPTPHLPNPGSPIIRHPSPITYFNLSRKRIAFHTRSLNAPHIIACTWHPNWTIRGAERIYRVTPGFMLVYPTDNSVELRYGFAPVDHVARTLSLLTCLWLVGMGLRHRRRLRERCVNGHDALSSTT